MNTKMMQLLCLLSIVISAANLNGMAKAEVKKFREKSVKAKARKLVKELANSTLSHSRKKESKRELEKKMVEFGANKSERERAFKDVDEILSRLADPDSEGNFVSKNRSQASHIMEKLLMIEHSKENLRSKYPNVSDEDLESIREIVRRKFAVPLANQIAPISCPEELKKLIAAPFPEEFDEDSEKKLCTDV